LGVGFVVRGGLDGGDLELEVGKGRNELGYLWRCWGGPVDRVEDDGGLGHVARSDDEAKLLEGVDVEADVLVAGAQVGEAHVHGEVVGLGEAGAVDQEMGKDAAIVLDQLGYRLRCAGEGVRRRCGLVLLTVAGGWRVGVLGRGHLYAVLSDRHYVAGHGPVFGVVLQVEALDEGALEHGTNCLVRVVGSGGCGGGIGAGLGRLGRLDGSRYIEAVEVDPGGSTENGVLVAVEGKCDEVEHGGVLHVEATMAQIGVGVDHPAIGRGVDIDDEGRGVRRGCWSLLSGGCLGEEKRRCKRKEGGGSADDLDLHGCSDGGPGIFLEDGSWTRVTKIWCASRGISCGWSRRGRYPALRFSRAFSPQFVNGYFPAAAPQDRIARAFSAQA
jgi:hypothetical protein